MGEVLGSADERTVDLTLARMGEKNVSREEKMCSALKDEQVLAGQGHGQPTLLSADLPGFLRLS